MDIDIGADAKDWSAVQATEKLKPIETELRRIEEMVAEIVKDMEYLRGREQKLRDTNESTNTRVKWFAWSTMGILVALGVWQIMYLRAYFRYASFGEEILYMAKQILTSSADRSISFNQRGNSRYCSENSDRRRNRRPTKTCIIWRRSLEVFTSEEVLLPIKVDE